MGTLTRCSGAARAIRRCSNATRKLQICACPLAGRIASDGSSAFCGDAGPYVFAEWTTPVASPVVGIGEVYIARVAGISRPSGTNGVQTQTWAMRLLGGSSAPWGTGFVHAECRVGADLCAAHAFDRWYTWPRYFTPGTTQVGWRFAWEVQPNVEGINYSECFAEIIDCKLLVRQEFDSGSEAHVRVLQTLPHRVETGVNGSMEIRHSEPIAYGWFAGKRVRVQLAGGHTNVLLRPNWRLRLWGCGAPGQVVPPGMNGPTDGPVIWENTSGASSFSLDQVFDFTSAATWPSSVYSRAVLVLEFQRSLTNGIDNSFCQVVGVTEV